MIILVTSKNEEDSIKIEGARVATILILIFKHSKAANSAVQGRILLKFKLIQDVMVTLVTSQNEEDPIKIEGARVATTQNIDFSNTQGSAVRGQIWSKFELIRDIVVILVTCKNKEDPLKNKDARVATTQNINFLI